MKRRKLLGWIVFSSLLSASFLGILFVDSFLSKLTNGTILTTPVLNVTVRPGAVLFFSTITRENTPYIFLPSPAGPAGGWGVTRLRQHLPRNQFCGILTGDMTFPWTTRGKAGHFALWVFPGFDYRYVATDTGQWTAWSLEVSLLIPIALLLVVAAVFWRKQRRQPCPTGRERDSGPKGAKHGPPGGRGVSRAAG